MTGANQPHAPYTLGEGEMSLDAEFEVYITRKPLPINSPFIYLYLFNINIFIYFLKFKFITAIHTDWLGVCAREHWCNHKHNT